MTNGKKAQVKPRLHRRLNLPELGMSLHATNIRTLRNPNEGFHTTSLQGEVFCPMLLQNTKKKKNVEKKARLDRKSANRQKALGVVVREYAPRAEKLE